MITWYIFAGIVIGVFGTSLIWLLCVTIPMIKDLLEFIDTMGRVYENIAMANNGIYTESEDK